ncbi:MAG: DUF3363 domain-containing protein [Thiohalocapsa sp.]
MAQSRRGSLRVLSICDLDRQIPSDGATWLDPELASWNRPPLTAGFGAEVRHAVERNKDALVDQGMATQTSDGGVRAPRDLFSRMERQEIARVGPEMARAEASPSSRRKSGITFRERWSNLSISRAANST